MRRNRGEDDDIEEGRYKRFPSEEIEMTELAKRMRPLFQTFLKPEDRKNVEWWLNNEMTDIGLEQQMADLLKMYRAPPKGKGKICRKKGKSRGGNRISGRGKTTKPPKRLPLVVVSSSPPSFYDHEEERKKKAIMADMRKLGVPEKDLPPTSLPYKMLEILRQAQQDVVDSEKEYAKLSPLLKRHRPIPIPPSLESGEIDLDKILADAEFSKQLFSSP